MWQTLTPYTKLTIEIGALLLLALAFRFIRSKIRTSNYTNRYKKRTSVMTAAEQKFFRQLQQEYGEKYLIFPQINLDKLLEVEGSRNNYAARNKIAQKSVDFVLADKETLSTQLVIELDDWTHDLARRKKRDEFVNQLLEQHDFKIERSSFKVNYKNSL